MKRYFRQSLCEACLKLGGQGAVSTALIQIVPLLLAGAHAAGAGRVVARAALGLHFVVGKNEHLARGEGDGSALVILARLGVVLIADVVCVIARGVFPPAGPGNTGVHAVVDGRAVVVRTQHGPLRKCFLNYAPHVCGHSVDVEGRAAAEQMRPHDRANDNEQ